MTVKKIIFRDLQKRDESEREHLKAEKVRLNALAPNLTDEEKDELARIESVLNGLLSSTVVDPLFVATRDAFNDNPGLASSVLADHAGGVLKGVATAAPASGSGGTGPVGLSDADTVTVAHVLGILAMRTVQAPRVVRDDTNIIADKHDEPAYGNFITAFYAAFGEARGAVALATLVLPILEIEGDRDGRGKNPSEVETKEFARVVRCLRDKGITEKEAQLSRRVNECLDEIQDVANGSIVNLSIDLPDLNETTELEVQAENVESYGPLICAAMFDDLKAFAVVDRLFEQWQQGNATIPHGSEVGRMLYDYWKSAPNRMSEGERRNFYALTMGIPGGNANTNVNREFNDLWIRFVSSVSSLVRARTTDNLLRATIPASFGQQQVRKAARDLAICLSSHAYGMVTYAARDLQDQIKTIINILGHKDTLTLYGARDMWQVIDHIVTLELGGGARNSARIRSLATCGSIITKWLAQNVEKYSASTSIRQVIDITDVVSSAPRSAGKKATTKPTDYDLVNACELWLADTAISEARVEELSQPRESPAMTSRPVPIPSIAREMLEGVVPGMGMGMNRH